MAKYTITASLDVDAESADDARDIFSNALYGGGFETEIANVERATPDKYFKFDFSVTVQAETEEEAQDLIQKDFDNQYSDVAQWVSECFSSYEVDADSTEARYAMKREDVA